MPDVLEWDVSWSVKAAMVWQAWVWQNARQVAAHVALESLEAEGLVPPLRILPENRQLLEWTNRE